MLNVVAYAKFILFPFLHFIFKFFLITAVLFLFFLPPLFSRTSNIDILSSLFCTSVWYYFIDIMRVPQFLHLFYLFCFCFFFLLLYIMDPALLISMSPRISLCPWNLPRKKTKHFFFLKKIKNQWKQTKQELKRKTTSPSLKWYYQFTHLTFSWWPVQCIHDCLRNWLLLLPRLW